MSSRGDVKGPILSTPSLNWPWAYNLLRNKATQTMFEVSVCWFIPRTALPKGGVLQDCCTDTSIFACTARPACCYGCLGSWYVFKREMLKRATGGKAQCGPGESTAPVRRGPLPCSQFTVHGVLQEGTDVVQWLWQAAQVGGT